MQADESMGLIVQGSGEYPHSKVLAKVNGKFIWVKIDEERFQEHMSKAYEKILAELAVEGARHANKA